MRVLVVAPHPDDEVLGCGATIAKHSKMGDEVFLCIVTKAYTPDWTEEFIKNRPIEVANACKILGIRKSFFLDFPTAKLDTIPQKMLNDSISTITKSINPNVVYTPYKHDLNKDHRLVFEAVVTATRFTVTSSVERFLMYETLSETHWTHYGERAFSPNVYVDISETLETKLKAMSAYPSELNDYPHPRSQESIRALAKKRGTESGLNAAEAFILSREIIR